MHKFGIMHPHFFYAPRPVIQSAMLGFVEIYEPTGIQPSWAPGQTDEGDESLILRWRGSARIQPDKDWRARVRNFANEFDAIQAVRVQVGINSNLYTGPGAKEDFAKDWVVVVKGVDVIGAETIVGDRFYVRNALKSTNPWVHNLLCDGDARERG